MKSLDSYLHGLELHGELYSENYLTIGENYEALGRYDMAKKIYQYISCNHTCGREEALLSLAMIYQLEGNKAKAKRILWKVIKADFSNEKAWYGLFYIFRDEEDFARAIITLKEAYRYIPFSFPYLEELKKIYKELQDKWHHLSTIIKLRRDKIRLRRYTEIGIEYVNEKLVFTGKEFGRFKVLYRLDIQETEKKLFNPVRIFIQDSYRKKSFIPSIPTILEDIKPLPPLERIDLFIEFLHRLRKIELLTYYTYEVLEPLQVEFVHSLQIIKSSEPFNVSAGLFNDLIYVARNTKLMYNNFDDILECFDSIINTFDVEAQENEDGVDKLLSSISLIENKFHQNHFLGPVRFLKTDILFKDFLK